MYLHPYKFIGKYLKNKEKQFNSLFVFNYINFIFIPVYILSNNFF